MKLQVFSKCSKFFFFILLIAQASFSDETDRFVVCIYSYEMYSYTYPVVNFDDRVFFFFFFFCLFPGFRRVRSPLRNFYFMYNIWQDARNRTRIAATAARCATNELHTSLSTPVFLKKHDQNLGLMYLSILYCT